MHPTSRLGVGIVVINRFGKVLMLRRIAEGLNGWEMPEGEITRAETPRNAVLRLLQEAISTDAVEIVGESQSWRTFDAPDPAEGLGTANSTGQRRQKWFLVLFTRHDGSIRLVSDNPEFDAWRWVSPEELIALAVQGKRPLYRDILEELAGPIGDVMRLISVSPLGSTSPRSRDLATLGPREEVDVDGGPLGVTAGEVNFIQGFVHDGSIGAECGLQLMRYWGYCERHAWVSLAVELALLHGFCSRSATLYTDILRQGIAALSLIRRSPRAVAKGLKESGTCMICNAKPRSRGLLSTAELTKGKDIARLRALAEGSASFWSSDCCPRCIDGMTYGHLCRRHLIEALNAGASVNLEEEHQHLLNVLSRLENYAWSFSWDFRGIDGPEDRAALISAIGWSSGWSSLAAVIPLGHPSPAPHLRNAS
jgi:putative (di)nucleoside polyphosphate hydrolase